MHILILAALTFIVLHAICRVIGLLFEVFFELSDQRGTTPAAWPETPTVPIPKGKRKGWLPYAEYPDWSKYQHLGKWQ